LNHLASQQKRRIAGKILENLILTGSFPGLVENTAKRQIGVPR
jgi:hypothetical protein